MVHALSNILHGFVWLGLPAFAQGSYLARFGLVLCLQVTSLVVVTSYLSHETLTYQLFWKWGAIVWFPQTRHCTDMQIGIFTSSVLELDVVRNLKKAGLFKEGWVIRQNLSDGKFRPKANSVLKLNSFRRLIRRKVRFLNYCWKKNKEVFHFEIRIML